jgi:hypothetical protein
MLNKSGGYAANKHIAARQDAMAPPPEVGTQDTSSEPQSFQVDKTPEGYHSVTQHADGNVEEADHGSYDEVRNHMDAKFAGKGDQESDGDGSEMNESGEDNENCV